MRSHPIPVVFCHWGACAMLFGSSLLLHMHAARSLARSLSSRRHAECGPDLRRLAPPLTPAPARLQVKWSGAERGAVTHKFASNYVVVNEREYLHGRRRERRERELDQRTNEPWAWKEQKRQTLSDRARPSLIHPVVSTTQRGREREEGRR